MRSPVDVVIIEVDSLSKDEVCAIAGTEEDATMPPLLTSPPCESVADVDTFSPRCLLGPLSPSTGERVDDLSDEPSTPAPRALLTPPLPDIAACDDEEVVVAVVVVVIIIIIVEY